MIERINKYFWIVAIVFVVACAYVASGFAVQIAGKKLAPAARSSDTSKVKAGLHTAKPSLNYYSIILNRNVFNSAHSPLEALENGEAVSGPSSLKLLGTIAWTETRSIAVIEDKSSRKIDAYKPGDNVGGYEITRIERGKVYLSRNGSEEVLELPEFAKVSSAVSHSGSSKGRVGQFAKLPGINRRGDQFEVDHSVIERAMTNMGSLLRSARVVPYLKDGKLNGFKILGIKKGSLYEQIGLKNRDVIQRVNGIDLNGPEQALQLFEILRNERQITVDIVRGGRQQTLSYTIR